MPRSISLAALVPAPAPAGTTLRLILSNDLDDKGRF
jgi:hypothetical protein